MMSRDNFTGGVSRKRAVLGDLTNHQVKRGFSSASDDLGHKSGDGNGKNVVSEDANSRFAKQLCLRVANLFKDESKTNFGADTRNENDVLALKDSRACDSSSSDTETDSSLENLVSAVPCRPDETKETSILLDPSVNFVKSGTITQSVGEVDDASGDSCASSGSMPTGSGPCKKDSDDEGRVTSKINENDPVGPGFLSTRDLGIGKVFSSECDSVEWPGLPQPQSSKSFGLDRCTALKGDGCANLNAGADLLKACSCSFCLKAAYIWSDLHYQDIKGRITALKKSQKEVSIMYNKYARGMHADIHSQGHSNRSTKLESDLTGQWKYLFRHMEDTFTHESSQLQANFVALKDLRENCKMDLERTTGIPLDKS